MFIDLLIQNPEHAFVVNQRNLAICNLPDLSSLRNLQHLDLSGNNQLLANQQTIDQLSALSDGLSNLRFLDLSGTGLSDAEWIFQLPSLAILRISSNNLNRLWKSSQFEPACLKLKVLNVSHNKLIQLPPEIRYLTNLKQLYIYNNKLAQLPTEIRYLTNLTELIAYANQLTDLPSSIRFLTKLNELKLNNNQLSHLPCEIRFLTNLMEINISDNVFDTPLQEPDFVDSFQPSNHLTQSRNGKEIVAYAEEWSRGQVRLNRFKVALVGDGAAGKTSLKNTLLNQNQQATPRTTSILRHEWQPPHVSDWMFDVWDFPGQAQHYATHNLFLSDWQCVFVIVCDVSLSNWESRLEYWVSFLRCKSSFVIDRYHRHHFSNDYLSRNDTSKSMDPRVAFTCIVVGSHFDLVPAIKRQARTKDVSYKVKDLSSSTSLRHITFACGGIFNLASSGGIGSLVALLVDHGNKMSLSSRSLVPSSYKQVLKWIQDKRSSLSCTIDSEDEGVSPNDEAPLVTMGELLESINAERCWIDHQRLVWILKQLHSFGEIAFMPLEVPPGHLQQDELEIGAQPVALSFNWLLARIGELFDKPDSSRDSASQVDVISHRQALISDAAGSLTTFDLRKIWNINRPQCESVATILESMMLCYRKITEGSASRELSSSHANLRFVFPLLLPELDDNKRVQMLQSAPPHISRRSRRDLHSVPLAHCRWIRSDGVEALPPGSFGLLQVELFNRIQSVKPTAHKYRLNVCGSNIDGMDDEYLIWRKLDTKNYLHETHIAIDGDISIVISFHNPSLTILPAECLDSSRSPLGGSTSGPLDSMMSCCLLGEAASSDLSFKVWRSLIAMIHRLCHDHTYSRKHNPRTAGIREEIPCIECVRARWPSTSRFSVCRVVSVEECRTSTVRSKYRCSVTKEEVFFRTLLSTTDSPPTTDRPPSAASLAQCAIDQENTEQQEITELNAALWDLSRSLQSSGITVLTTLKSNLCGLASSIVLHLDAVRLCNCPFAWRCESQVIEDGSFARVDVIMVMIPALPNRSVKIDLKSNKCSFVVTPTKPTSTSSSRGISIGDESLNTIWNSFRSAIEGFADEYREKLKIQPINSSSERLVSVTEANDCSTMSCRLILDCIPVSINAALQSPSNNPLILYRKMQSDGANIQKCFTQECSLDRYSPLPTNGKLMICAMVHAVSLIDCIDAPLSLFSSIVLNEFEWQGWTGDEVDEIEQSLMIFISVWRLCWNRVRLECEKRMFTHCFDERTGSSRLSEHATHFISLSELELLVELKRAVSGAPQA